jgi:hypothetical protein
LRWHFIEIFPFHLLADAATHITKLGVYYISSDFEAPFKARQLSPAASSHVAAALPVWRKSRVEMTTHLAPR